MKKRLLHCVFVICLAFIFFPKTIFAAEIVETGKTGEYAVWTLYEDGRFVVSGTGDMEEYRYRSDRPWNAYCEAVTLIVVEEGITSVGSHAFAECTNAVEAYLPDSLTSIGSSAFLWCDSLDTIIIPENVDAIGSDAFSHCMGMESIYFQGAAPEIGMYLFDGMNITIYYPEEENSWNSSIQWQEFGANTNWVSYTLIGEKSIVDSGACGKNVEWYLSNLGQLTIEGNGPMKEYDSKEELPWYEYSKQINQVRIKEGVTTISPMAFYKMEALGSVSIPRGLTHVGDYAFKHCKNLYHVHLPKSLKRIGESAFYGCRYLWDINIPEGIYTIWEYTFKGCTNLKDIAFPDTLIKIDQGAFENCTRLYSVIIPEDTDIVGAWSFKGCTGLNRVDMEGIDATEIREGAFKNCSALTDILLPPDIQILGDSCFYGIGATSFTVPETVTSVEPWCFARANVKEITFEGEAPTIGEGSFNKISLTAYYPNGNATWTSSIMQNYGGMVTWKAK